MSQMFKRYSQDGAVISAVERIFVKSLKREEFRFAWYKEKDGSMHFKPRPLYLRGTIRFV